MRAEDDGQAHPSMSSARSTSGPGSSFTSRMRLPIILGWHRHRHHSAANSPIPIGPQCGWNTHTFSARALCAHQRCIGVAAGPTLRMSVFAAPRAAWWRQAEDGGEANPGSKGGAGGRRLTAGDMDGFASPSSSARAEQKQTTALRRDPPLQVRPLNATLSPYQAPAASLARILAWMYAPCGTCSRSDRRHSVWRSCSLRWPSA